MNLLSLLLMFGVYIAVEMFPSLPPALYIVTGYLLCAVVEKIENISNN